MKLRCFEFSYFGLRILECRDCTISDFGFRGKVCRNRNMNLGVRYFGMADFGCIGDDFGCRKIDFRSRIVDSNLRSALKVGMRFDANLIGYRDES